MTCTSSLRKVGTTPHPSSGSSSFARRVAGHSQKQDSLVSWTGFREDEHRSPVLGSIYSEDNLRRIVRPWTEEDIAQLKRLQALGASPARASVALKRSRLHVMERARALGVPFMTMREQRKRQASREAAERMAAGLPPKQRW
jgi:hypothetical protein